MTDLELYQLIKENTNEFHEDGMFFVPAYAAKDFLYGLGIRDAEDGIDCRVVTDGCLVFDMHDFESKFETDIEKVIEMLNKDIGYE